MKDLFNILGFIKHFTESIHYLFVLFLNISADLLRNTVIKITRILAIFVDFLYNFFEESGVIRGSFGFSNIRVHINADIPKVLRSMCPLALKSTSNQNIHLIRCRQRQFLKLSRINKIHKLRRNQIRKPLNNLQVILIYIKVFMKQS